jgi:hypothetical protein
MNSFKSKKIIPSKPNKVNIRNEQGELAYDPESDKEMWLQINENKKSIPANKERTKRHNKIIQAEDDKGRLNIDRVSGKKLRSLVSLHLKRKSRKASINSTPIIPITSESLDETRLPNDANESSTIEGLGMSNRYKSVKISKLSPTQQRKLKKGEKLIIKAGNDHEIMLSPEQEKKFNKKSMMGCGITIQLDPYQQDLMSGEGFKSFVGKVKRAAIGKKIIKFAKDTKLAKRVGDALIERAVKTIAGAGVETKRKRGRPKKGGALMPAGGALRPAGY